MTALYGYLLALLGALAAFVGYGVVQRKDGKADAREQIRRETAAVRDRMDDAERASPDDYDAVLERLRRGQRARSDLPTIARHLDGQ